MNMKNIMIEYEYEKYHDQVKKEWTHIEYSSVKRTWIYILKYLYFEKQ